MAAAWRAPKTGVGAPKSSVPGPWLASSPQDPRALGAEDTRAGRRGPETAAPSSAGDRPGAGGGAGAQERGRPGPGAARPPAAPRAARAALPGVRILGDRAVPRSPLVSPRGPRGRDRSLCRGWLRLGAGQLGLRGGPRQDRGGRIAAEGGGGGRSALGTRRRRQRRSLLLLLLPPPLPPARLGVGGGLRGTGSPCGREPRPPPSAPPPPRPPTSSRAPRTGLQDTRAPPAPSARLPEPQAPPTPARREAVAPGKRPGRATHARAAGHVTANRRAPGIYEGRGTRAPGRHLLRRGWGRVVTPAPEPRKGSGTKDLHVLGSLRREARKPAAPSFCNHAKPFPVFAEEGSSERVLMNGKARTEVARFSLQIVLGGGCF